LIPTPRLVNHDGFIFSAHDFASSPEGLAEGTFFWMVGLAIFNGKCGNSAGKRENVSSQGPLCISMEMWQTAEFM
jgi:hypothetical protein